MFIVISPAKKLDFDSAEPALPEQTQPRFLDQSETLVDQLKQLAPQEIAKLMKVSDKIAALNVDRFSLWDADMSEPRIARAAALAFRGDTYQGLAFDTLNKQQMQQAQKQLRILSGLYGLLRPLDRIRAYRLEMGTRLATEYGKNLYQFWGDRLSLQLAADMESEGSELLVNLASQEYFKAVDRSVFPYPIVQPVFEDYKNGQYKVISFYAKRARGMMANWIVSNQPKQAGELASFNLAGYRFASELSCENRPIFRRNPTL